MNPTPPKTARDSAGDSETTRLDADVVQALCAAVADEPVAVARREGLRRRLLRRVAAAGPAHLTIAPDDASDGSRWQPFAEGIRIRVLHRGEGTLSYLLRLDAGACLPPHRHRQDEECVVLEGRLRIGDDVVVPAGGYHLARAGSLHAPIVADTASTIFLRGAAPEIADLI
jgi:hypothetical protein